MWKYHFTEVNLGFAHYVTAAFWWTTLLIIFKGIKGLQLISFFSSLCFLTIFIKKDFCTSIKSIIYCRPLEISRDNCKAKKSAFSLLLEILECFFLAELQKIENRYSFSLVAFVVCKILAACQNTAWAQIFLSKSGPTPSVSSVRCFTGKEGGNSSTWKKKVVSLLQEGQGFLFIIFYNTWLTDGQD